MFRRSCLSRQNFEAVGQTLRKVFINSRSCARARHFYASAFSVRKWRLLFNTNYVNNIVIILITSERARARRHICENECGSSSLDRVISMEVSHFEPLGSLLQARDVNIVFFCSSFSCSSFNWTDFDRIVFNDCGFSEWEVWCQKYGHKLYVHRIRCSL